MSATPNAVASSSTPHKSQKKHKSKDKERKDKGKSKDKSEKTGPFEHRTSRLRLSIPPKYAGDYLAGVQDILNGMLMRYVPQMNGVLLAHWEHELLDDTVKIINECPYGVCEVKFYSILWAPKVGQRLYGSHSLSSPSHISLLFSKTFNISIPLQHIPTEEYEFEHTAPEEDADELDSEDELELEATGVEEVGRWKRKSDGKLLGESGKGVKFTVIGMQVTNQMLSLTGSLLADPSNPPPPPETQSIRAPPSPSLSPSPMEVDEPAPPRAKKQRQASNGHAASAPGRPAPQAIAEPQIDERFLSARELKKKRKDEEKRKRDERKSRKEAGQIEVLEEAGAEIMVGMNGDEAEVGMKRKAGDGAGEGKKRKKQG